MGQGPYMKQYFVGLNGIRAIIALAVLFSHISLAIPEIGLNALLFGKNADGSPKGYLLAGFGVSIFFVLSGFLITYLLLEEQQRQKINIRHFYIRRTLRIWPLYYVYLIIVLFIPCVSDVKIDFAIASYYFILLANVPFIKGLALPLLGHYWSLAVEEQFYIWWPWIVKKLNTHIFKIATCTAGILIFVKCILHVYFPGSIAENIIHVTRFHCILIGCAGAIAHYHQNEIFLLWIDNKITQLICWMIFLILFLNQYHFISFLDNEIISIVGLGLIIGQINIKNRIINLETRILIYLGKISYGIYVIHPLVIWAGLRILSGQDVNITIKYLSVYIAIPIITIFVAQMSYAYLEKHFLDVKEKFSGRNIKHN